MARNKDLNLFEDQTDEEKDSFLKPHFEHQILNFYGKIISMEKSVAK